MDHYGLTEMEKNYYLMEYNHPLFDNMKAFMDSCWEINLETQTVVMLHETLKPEYAGRQFDYNRILSEYGEHYVYSLDRSNWYKMLSIAALEELSEETAVELHLIGVTGMPEICRFIITPAPAENKNARRVYLSSKNIESDIKMLREMQEEKQIIFAAMGVTYPIIIYSNLTRNSYMLYMLTEYNMNIPMGGTYDSLVRIISDNILPQYRAEYSALYARERLEKRLTTDGQYIEIEYEQNIGGSAHWLSSKTVRINNPYNSDFMAITLISIIDEQRHNEYVAKMALQDAYHAALDAERAKSEFLSRMSHEMLTPLNTIQGLVSLGKTHDNTDERILHLLEEIETANKQLSTQISRLLDTSLLESDTITLCEAPAKITAELLTTAKQMRELSDKKHITLDIICDEIIHNDVICDATRIGQVFGALLTNAVKFTDEGGHITATLREGYGRRSGFGYYEFIVEDNGVGIQEEYFERIFEPFERIDDNRISKNPGSGLGLYIVRSITKLMGGNITMTSTYGEGSVFTASFFLKLASSGGTAESAEHAPENPTEEKLTFEGKRILVVEDNDLNNEIISEILREMKFEVECAFDGLEAVEMVLAAEPGHYDAVLMDIMMPIKNGYEATEEIRAADRADLKTLPIIAASANSYPADIEMSLKSGMNDHIAKPIEGVSLAKVLDHWINQKH